MADNCASMKAVCDKLKIKMHTCVCVCLDCMTNAVSFSVFVCSFLSAARCASYSINNNNEQCLYSLHC